jgi:hypothetical protein
VNPATSNSVAAKEDFPRAWRDKIKDCLPGIAAVSDYNPEAPRARLPKTRALREIRANQFILLAMERIRLWREVKPEIEPYREKLQALAEQADKIRKIQSNLKKIKGSIEQMGKDSGNGLELNTATGALLACVKFATENWGVDSWNKLWRPKASRPRSCSVALGKALLDEYLLCFANDQKSTQGIPRGFRKVLEAIEEHTRPRLPHLEISALQKRRQRSKDKNPG